MPSQKNPAPLALQWLCSIRDHGLDLKVTQGERALASLLPTYGQGKNIFVTMKGLARVTGWSRTTVIKHRDGLIAKGLLEDITGDPGKQERTYCLTFPGYVKGGVQDLDTGVQNLGSGVQNLDTGCSGSDHNIKPLDQEVDLQLHHHHADGGVVEDLSSQSQDRAEDGPSSAPSSLDDGDAVDDDRKWDRSQGIDWDDPDDGGAVADTLGVPMTSIGKPFRDWLDGLFRAGTLDFNADFLAIDAALRASALKNNPVGYFKAILPGYVAELRSIGKTAFHAKHPRQPDA